MDPDEEGLNDSNLVEKQMAEDLHAAKKELERQILTGKSTEEDNWIHRSANMRCGSCMYFVKKEGRVPGLGRCRRNAPTLGGWPAIFDSDWCGAHKLDENAII